jgi:hypothetical protein
LSPTTTDELRRLLHRLREPLGAFAIRLTLLDDATMDDAARAHVDAMLAEVQRMTRAVEAITARFGLEVGDSTPLAIIHRESRRFESNRPDRQPDR